MSVFDLLRGVQDARAQIEIWGLSLSTLLWVGLAALVLFAFSLREILAWYLKINGLRRELKEVRAQLSEIRALLGPKSTQ